MNRIIYARLLIMLFAMAASVGHAAPLSSSDAASGSQSPTTDDRPNIIFILTDDQGIDAIEGSSAWPNHLNCHTPNLATFAAQGRVFSNMRVNPRCTPTRAGILSGRTGFQTGAIGILYRPSPDHEIHEWEGLRLSLQPEERTLPEVLQDSGYETIHVDKWHVGQWPGYMPEDHGFSISHEMEGYIYLDDVIEVGDEHITRMVDVTVDAIATRNQPDAPYLLFFWSYDAHSRRDPNNREGTDWWKVDESLLPSGEDYYSGENNTTTNRYRAVVEALDTELGRLLLELGVVDEFGQYRSESNTIVFFMSDNGTPPIINGRRNRSKASLFEFGVRVPCFTFGAGVPGDGEIDDRLVTHMDLFATFCDIAAVPPDLRKGPFPRLSQSFADSIGWRAGSLPDRQYQVMNEGSERPDRHQVALVDKRWKLIARGGGPGFDETSNDRFYDLKNDPGELDNLIVSGLDDEAHAAWLQMRDAIVDYWPSAVSIPLDNMIEFEAADMMMRSSAEYSSTGPMWLGHAYVDVPGRQESEHRVFVRFDVTDLEQRLPFGRTIDDVDSAQLILTFDRDVDSALDAPIGTIRAYPMMIRWGSDIPLTWADLSTGHDNTQPVGSLSLAPHIVPDPAGRMAGVPLMPWSPVSFGRSSDLADLVRTWVEQPETNHGVVCIADRLDDVYGEQRVMFQPQAFLRLTLRGE